MSENPVAISQHSDGSEKLTVSFTRQQFEDFVFSLIQTPSDETRVEVGGFDIGKLDIRRIIDKLHYFIDTNNNLVHEEFQVKLNWGRGRQQVFYTKERFFNVELGDIKEVKGLTLTLTYLVAFKRTDSERSLERQVVSIRFDAGTPGIAQTNIRSTEFSWPDAIFRIVADEVSDLKEKISRQNPLKQSIWLMPARWINSFREPQLPYSVFEFLAERSSRSPGAFIIGVLIAATFALSLGVVTGASSLRTARLYDPSTSTFQSVDPELLITEHGWREAAAILRDSESLYRFRFSFIQADDLIKGAFFNGFVLPLIVSGLLLFSFLLISFREAARIRINTAGRIFVTNEPVAARQPLPSSTGIIEALGFGILGNALFGGILAVVQVYLVS